MMTMKIRTTTTYLALAACSNQAKSAKEELEQKLSLLVIGKKENLRVRFNENHDQCHNDNIFNFGRSTDHSGGRISGQSIQLSHSKLYHSNE